MGHTLMKDGLGEAAIKRINDAFLQLLPGFPGTRFTTQAENGLADLELKERVAHIIAVLGRFLPPDFPETAAVLREIPAVWDHGDPDDPLRGFAAWPITDYVGVHGGEHVSLSLDVLKELTGLFSAEFSIRPFLIQNTAQCLERLQTWSSDPDHHVRRLVSEGTRPRLPWGSRLPMFVRNPRPILPLLDKLVDDDSLYVRRSVANNLNDISKDHPETAIAQCSSWLLAANERRRWVVRHALRSLIKAGNPEVFPLLGYTRSPQIAVGPIALNTDSIGLDDTLCFSATIKSTGKSEQTVVVDYAIHFMKANGQQRAKVFKLKVLNLSPGQACAIEKRHTFKKIKTRRYYPGGHRVELLINGCSRGRAVFTLRA